MKKSKQKYNIYLIEEQHNLFIGRFDRIVTKIGETYAVSKAQAISNYCFREGVRRSRITEDAFDVTNHDYIDAEPALNEWRRKYGEETLEAVPEECHIKYSELKEE